MKKDNYLNINVNDLLNESSSSDDSLKNIEVKKMLKASTAHRPVQDHYDQDVDEIERELNMKYGIQPSPAKKFADISDDSDDSSPQRTFLSKDQPTNKQRIIDELCKSSSSSENSQEEKKASSDDFYKELESGKSKIQPKQGVKRSLNSSPPEFDRASSNYMNLNFDIDKELEKQTIQQNFKQDDKEQNFLQIVEKNEKLNEAIPESVQQANQLLSFDKQFYNNVKNRLMVYEDYPIIAKKLHQQDHKFYGLVSCISMLKTFLFVGNSSGIIRVFDLKSQKEMKPLLDQSLMKNDSKVTCMDIAGGTDPQNPYGLLLSGYKNGSLALWDLIEYKLLKYIPNIHETDVTNVKIYRVLNNGGSIHAISSEDQGGVRYLEINKKAIFGGYNYNSEYLFKSKLQGTTAIAIYQPNPSYPNLFCDTSSLLAVGGINMITICTMKPIDCIYSINKPSFCKEKAIPYIDWGFGLTPSHREKTVPIMAFAWDRVIQLIYINDEGTSLDIDGFYYSEKEIISLSFVGDGIIFAIFEGLDGREAKILYTTKFYPGSYRTIEESFNNQGDMILEFERVAQVTMHAELEKSHEILELRSQVLHSYSQMNYNNSIQKHKQNILLLGQKSIQRGRLFAWKEYIEFIQYSQNYDWLSVLKVALEIYNGDIKGYANVPDEKEIREEKLKGYMQDLIKTNIQQVLQKFKKKEISENTSTTGSGSSSGEYQADQIAIKVAIEFCLNISTTNFLFTQMLELFEQHNLRQKFIQNLEQFIISGQFRKEHIPEDILSEFLSFYENKGYDVSLQERNLERIVQQLDLRNYTDMMRARLEILCESNCMVSALLALQGAQNNKDQSIITTMFKLMKKVGLREKKEEAKGIYPYVKKDIQMLFIVDSKKKYEIEKSKCYIGYKLLWIIKMYLEGRQFPYGSLQHSQWEIHVNQIASLLNDNAFLREFLDFDAKCFFDVIQKLFYGEPFQFIAHQSKDNYPLKIVNKIQETVEIYTKTFKAQINKELHQNIGYQVEAELPQIMSQFYFFILHVEVEHQRYQVKLQNEIEVKKKKQIQVNLNRIELKLNFSIIYESINQVLIYWSNNLDTKHDESIIIEAISSQSTHFTLAHNDILLKQLDDLNLQTCLINLRIFLLEQRGDYLQSFRLHMTDDQLKEKVFLWIKAKFGELDKSLDQEKRFNELKSMVASHMKEIIQVDVDQTIELIEKYYDDSYSDQLILGELSQFPEVQFNFLTKFLHFNEVSIKIALRDANCIPEKEEQANKYNQYLCLQVELMCKLQAQKIGFVTPQVLEKFVEQDHYPIDQCLAICQKYHQQRAIAALLVRNNDLGSAIDTYMHYLKTFSLVQLGSELLQIIKDAQQRELKKKRTMIDQIPSTEELIRQYGDLWDYEECYKYKYLSEFDEILQKACTLAKRQYDAQGEEESWFKVLLVLDQWSYIVGVKLQEEANKNPKNLQILFQSKIGQDLNRVGGILSDFIMRRKNIILMIQVPLSISPQTLMDKLNLNLDSIRKIFEFKVKAIKGEKKFIKIANRLIIQEMINESEKGLNLASKGYQLEGDSGKNKLLTHIQRDICDNCELNLIQYQKCPIKVFFGCSHTFHQHCITKLQKELVEQAKMEGSEMPPSSSCPKCTKENANICFADKMEKLVPSETQLDKSEYTSFGGPMGEMTETIYNYRLEQFDINFDEAMINSDDFTR